MKKRPAASLASEENPRKKYVAGAHSPQADAALQKPESTLSAGASELDDASPGHVAHSRVKWVENIQTCRFYFGAGAEKFNFQTTAKAAGSREAAERIARLCYVYLESGATKQEALVKRGELYQIAGQKDGNGGGSSVAPLPQLQPGAKLSRCARISVKSASTRQPPRPKIGIRKRPAAVANAADDAAPTDVLVPAGSSNFEILRREIIKRSKAKDWVAAKVEWALACVYWQETGGQCLCTHRPIKEICVLRNGETQREAVVGNCCVKKFMENISSEIIFAAVRRVAQDGDKALNREVIIFARDQGWLTAWDYKFYQDTWRKRTMTKRQQKQRVRINKKVLRRLRDPEAESEESDVELWELNKDTLQQASEDGRISAWEHDFYVGNLNRRFVTAKQRPIKRRIEAKVAGTWAPRRRQPQPAQESEDSDKSEESAEESEEIQEMINRIHNERMVQLVSRENHAQQEIIEVSAAAVGRIIGKGGETIQRMQRESGAKINVERSQNRSSGLVQAQLVGTHEAIQRAKAMITEISQSVCSKEEVMEVPAVAVGRIIGRGGETIQRMQRESGARIIVDKSRTCHDSEFAEVRFVGSHEAVHYAKDMVAELSAVTCWRQ